jgi:hypothetical protein
MKALEINKDYGFVFGLDLKKNQHMIYGGGDTWTAKEGTRERTTESAGTTAKALEYINRPTVMMGTPR